jgi:hypothetical protein
MNDQYYDIERRTAIKEDDGKCHGKDSRTSGGKAGDGDRRVIDLSSLNFTDEPEDGIRPPEEAKSSEMISK